MHAALLRGHDVMNRGKDMQLIAFDCGVLHGPPNTLLAARRALQDGASALNVDLALTRDGRLVAAHSSTHWSHLHGLPAMEQDLSQLDFTAMPKTPPCSTFRKFWQSLNVPDEDLVGLEDCEPQPLSSVEEFLESFPNVPLHFDLKADSLELQGEQAQLLDKLMKEKFPQRAQVTDGSLTSVRFFRNPRHLVQPDVYTFLSLHGTLSHSLAVFLGDPADELGPIDSKHANEQELGLLNELAQGPELAPMATRGVYLPPRVLNQGWRIPPNWKDSLFVICDIAAEGMKPLTLDQRRVQESACRRASSSGMHTAYFRGLSAQSRLRAESLDQHRSLGLPTRWNMAFMGWPSLDPKLLPSEAGAKWQGSQSTWARCITKQFTALLIVQLIELGRIQSLDAPLLELARLPPSAVPAGKRGSLGTLTLRQVMSGVGAFQSSYEPLHWETSEGMSTVELTRRALLAIEPTNLLFKDKFVYSNQQWIAVERVIEVATGLSLPVAARQYVFDAIGMSKNTYYVDDTRPACPEYAGETQKQRNLRAGIGLCTTPEDLLLLGRTLVEEVGSKVPGVSPVTHRAVVSPAGVQELFKDQLATHFPKAARSVRSVYPFGEFISAGFMVVGRTLGAYVLDGGMIMAHGGDDLYVGAKLFMHVNNAKPVGPVFVQMAHAPQYSSKDSFLDNVPQSLSNISKCYALLFGAASPWAIHTRVDANFEPPCKQYSIQQ